MKKSFRKIVSLVMAVFMLLSCFMMTASAKTGTGSYTVDGYKYTFSYDTVKKTAELTIYTGGSTTWKLKNLVTCRVGTSTKNTDFTVTSLSSSFFYNSKSYSKRITYLRLPDTLENIQNGLFQGDYFTKLKTIEIYGAETTCNDGFMDCNALEEFVVNEDNTALKAVEGVLYNDGGLTLQKFPASKASDTGIYEVPAGTEKISKYAFYKVKNITEVNVPASVTTVGTASFCSSAIKAINLEEGCTFDAKTYSCICKTKGISPTCAEKAIFCANGHNLEPDGTTEATCGKDAANIFKCKVCGATEERPLVGTATGHIGGTATCTAKAVCSTCGVSYGELNTNAHSFTNYTYNNDATCDNDGTKTAVCANGCGAESKVTVAGTAKGHAFSNYEISAPAKCGVNAQETAKCANGCGATDTRDIAGSAIEHSLTSEITEKATCTKNALETVTCAKGCGFSETKEVANSALGHSFTKYETIREASCDKDKQEKAVCDNDGCRAYDVRTVDGTAFGHKAGEAVITGKVNPTCDKGGSYVETVKCQSCGEVISSAMKKIDALGHADANGDYVCDNGGEKLRSPQDDCKHMCHKSGFMGFLWKIGRFFQKLFKMNPVCECGAAHY